MGNDKMKKKKKKKKSITLQTHYLMPLFKLLSRRRDESVGYIFNSGLLSAKRLKN